MANGPSNRQSCLAVRGTLEPIAAMAGILLLSLSTSALQLPASAAPRLRASRMVRMQFAQPPDLSDETVFPKGPNGETLITYASLDSTGAQMIEMALTQRNKERILAGEPKYENVQAMCALARLARNAGAAPHSFCSFCRRVDAYLEFDQGNALHAG